jgi:site-specific DNA recombinase
MCSLGVAPRVSYTVSLSYMKKPRLDNTKAVGYVRVSTEEQSREGFSLDAQTAKITAYAALKGLELTAIVREEGVSAKIPLAVRPAGRMLPTYRAGNIIAVKLDRLFRSSQDAMNTSADWRDRGIALHIIDMGGTAIDTSSAVGGMFFALVAAFAEMERKLISERITAALGHKRSSGLQYTRIAPLGFRAVDGRLEPDEAEQRVVSRLLALRTDGLSMGKIAELFNTEGVATKTGGRWHAVTIQKVLQSASRRLAA